MNYHIVSLRHNYSTSECRSVAKKMDLFTFLVCCLQVFIPEASKSTINHNNNDIPFFSDWNPVFPAPAPKIRGAGLI
jgi:hypothetical protein